MAEDARGAKDAEDAEGAGAAGQAKGAAAAGLAVELAGVTFSYRAAPALDGVSLKVPRGGFWAIVGPNGSGKTTLLRCMSRALRPQAGAVLLEGSDVMALAARDVARRLAVVPQATPGEGAEFTVAEVVLMGRQPHLGRFETEGAGDWEAVRRALEQTQTLGLADRRFEELSGGERQRAVIARALAQEPRVLLLDEPTAHLDLAYQVQVLGLLQRLNRTRGLTVLAVMHDLNLAAQYFDSFMLLARGRVCAVGAAEEVLTAANIGRAYGGDVLVSRHPVHQRPLVTLVRGAGEQGGEQAGGGPATGEGVGEAALASTTPTAATTAAATAAAPGPAPNHASAPVPAPAEGAFTVHVIGGGGAAGHLMAELCRCGWRVTAGVLNRGDSDLERAEGLGIRVVTVPPFTPVGPREHAQNLALAKAADAVVMASVPFGPANVINLEAARAALAAGRTVVLVDEAPVSGRDYVGGAAAAAHERLVQGGAAVAGSVAAALRAIERAAGGTGSWTE